MAISSAAQSHECECTVVLTMPGITSTTWLTYLDLYPNISIIALTRAMTILISNFGLRIVLYSLTQLVK